MQKMETQKKIKRDNLVFVKLKCQSDKVNQ